MNIKNCYNSTREERLRYIKKNQTQLTRIQEKVMKEIKLIPILFEFAELFGAVEVELAGTEDDVPDTDAEGTVEEEDEDVVAFEGEGVT